jgi:uncharacterized glyoxalase superfamily protein PhnB
MYRNASLGCRDRIREDRHGGPDPPKTMSRDFIRLPLMVAVLLVSVLHVHAEPARPAVQPDGSHDFDFSLVVDNLERTYGQLREAGVELVSPPAKQEWGSFVIMIDSEGNKLLLKGDNR